MLFSLADNTIDIDIEKTKALYKKLPFIWQQCCCAACRNFEEHLVGIEPHRYLLFEEMGVVLLKSGYSWPYEPGDIPSTQKYCVRYPLVAEKLVLADNDKWERIDSGLLARFAETDKGIVLELDWTIKWDRY